VIEKAKAPLKILILGGTGFTGPHQVWYATQRGHQVTVFNRGQRQADLPKGVEHLTGDRNAPDGVAALKGSRTWDVIIDIPTTLPKWVRDAGQALQGRARQYIFISTISTYGNNFPKAWFDETAEVMKYEGRTTRSRLPPDQPAASMARSRSCRREKQRSGSPGKRRLFGRDSSLGRAIRRIASRTGRCASRVAVKCSCRAMAKTRSRSSTRATWPSG
jgi:hypothetical protein